VRIRRRLEAIGAVAVKSSVYALPVSEDASEDLRWLLGEIVRSGGEAFLAEASFIDGTTDPLLVSRCQETRNADYEELMRAASELRGAGLGTPSITDGSGAKTRRLAARLEEIKKIDFFHAPGRVAAGRAIEDLMRPPVHGIDSSESSVGPGRFWITRRGPKVDRISSAWLIKRFIDPDARFVFVDPATYSHAAGELRFDMFEGEYTHEGEACTFETLVARFGLDDPGLRALSEIVHDLDCKDEKFGRAEVAGVAAVIDGIVRGEPDDQSRCERGGAFLDALYEHFRPRPS
jgi:hypothetical protein